jgi:hypothetical protein
VVGVVHGAGVQLPEGVDHLARLQYVQLVEVGAHVVLHVLDHAPDVGDVRLRVSQPGGQRGLFAQAQSKSQAHKHKKQKH